MMTNMLHQKPMEDPKQYILQTLKSIQKADHQSKAAGVDYDPLDKNIYKFMKPFMTQEDFEAMFDAYDVLDVGRVPMTFMEHAMEQVGVIEAKQTLAERYPELLQEETVNKVSFVFVLESEHKRQGYSKWYISAT